MRLDDTPSDESKKADIERAVAKIEEVTGKVKETIQSMSSPLERSERLSLVNALQTISVQYLPKYLPVSPICRSYQEALRHCSSSVPYRRALCLADVAEDYVNPFRTAKGDVRVAREVIEEALKAAGEVGEERDCSKGLEEAWVRTKALAYVFRVLKGVDPEKAKDIRDEVLEAVDEHISEEERGTGPGSLLYESALLHAVEAVSKIDPEKALGISEKILGSSKRARALIHVLDSYIYYLCMMGVKVS